MRTQGPERPPSLKDFVHQKRPTNTAEYLAVFGFYREKHQGQPEIDEDAATDAFEASGCGRHCPDHLDQALRDAKNKYKYLRAGSKRGRFALTGKGRRLVLLHLPREDTESAHEQRVALGDLHPEVVRVAAKLFQSGHYSQAVFEAFKCLNNRVKQKSGLSSKDGRDLMAAAFKPANGPLRLNSGKTQSDNDEQDGYMLMFMGAMGGIRNPHAHENERTCDHSDAHQLLAFASVLHRKVDAARVKRSRSTRR